MKVDSLRLSYSRHCDPAEPTIQSLPGLEGSAVAPNNSVHFCGRGFEITDQRWPSQCAINPRETGESRKGGGVCEPITQILAGPKAMVSAMKNRLVRVG